MINIEKKMHSFKSNLENKLSSTRQSVNNLTIKPNLNSLNLPQINVDISKQRENRNKSFEMSKTSKKEKTYIKFFKSAIIKSIILLKIISNR